MTLGRTWAGSVGIADRRAAGRKSAQSFLANTQKLGCRSFGPACAGVPGLGWAVFLFTRGRERGRRLADDPFLSYQELPSFRIAAEILGFPAPLTRLPLGAIHFLSPRSLKTPLPKLE